MVKGIELHYLDCETKFASLFLHITFQDWHRKLQLMNGATACYNNDVESCGGQKINPRCGHDFIIGLALMIGVSVYNEQGCNPLHAGGR